MKVGGVELEGGKIKSAASLPDSAQTIKISVSNQAGRFALTTTSVQNGDVVRQTDISTDFIVVDATQLSTEAGYSQLGGSGGTTVHDNLTGLNAGEYKHLTTVEYSKLTSLEPVALYTAYEDMSAGTCISFFNDSGIKIRKASNVDESHTCNGFIKTAVTAGNQVAVYKTGVNISSDLTVGSPVYLSTNGTVTSTLPTTSGTVVQCLGTALTDTTFDFYPTFAITLA